MVLGSAWAVGAAPGVSYPTPREQVGDVLDCTLGGRGFKAPENSSLLPLPRRPEGRWTWLRTKDFTVVKSLQSLLAAGIETADRGLLSPELAAGIYRVKGVRKLGSRLGNRLTAELSEACFGKRPCSQCAYRILVRRDWHH